MPYATVLVLAPMRLRDHLHTYAVPEGLRDEVRPGILVRVPFGRHLLDGLVLGLQQEHPHFAVRDISKVVFSYPALSNDQIALLEWLRSHYLCSYQEAALLMIPRRLRPRPSREFYAVAGDASNAPAENDAPLLRWLRENRPATLERLRREGFEKGLSTRIKRLERSGLVEARWVAREIRAKTPSSPAAAPQESDRASSQPGVPPVLSIEQGAAWRDISESMSARDSATFLLHGVTGSGKTELYLRAVGKALRMGKSALILVPEISLTPQAIAGLENRFAGRVATIHSRRTERQRWDDWWRIRQGQVRVVVGARSAVFAPLADIGVVIVDEEHEWTYKNDETPRYHAREVAIELGAIHGATTILASATPDVVSYHRSQKGTYRLLTMKSRVVGAEPGIGGYAPAKTEMPEVEIVDMRMELRGGNRTVLSGTLRSSVEAALRGGEQAILFLNRRGSSTLMLCRQCGQVLRCPECETNLVFHRSVDSLLCHRCGRRYELAPACPSCGNDSIAFFGVGTERLEEETRKAFPIARVLRWDGDVAGDTAAPEDVLGAFARREAEILVGTQLVAKGLDFPGVTLVAAVAADMSLYIPDFRASERTFQLLSQAGGRAGRRRKAGKFIVQTYAPDHYSIRAAAGHDYLSFYRQEIQFRKDWGYPPFKQLARLVYSASRDSSARAEAEALACSLRGLIETSPDGGAVLGPSPCFMHRLRGRFRWQIILAAPDATAVLSKCPVPPGWSIDVDPVSMV